MQDPGRALARALDAIACAKRKPRRLDNDPVLQQLVVTLIAARRRISMTQGEVAALMRTTPSAVSRLESGRYARPSLTTIERYASAVGCRARIALDPVRPEGTHWWDQHAANFHRMPWVLAALGAQ